MRNGIGGRASLVGLACAGLVAGCFDNSGLGHAGKTDASSTGGSGPVSSSGKGGAFGSGGKAGSGGILGSGTVVSSGGILASGGIVASGGRAGSGGSGGSTSPDGGGGKTCGTAGPTCSSGLFCDLASNCGKITTAIGVCVSTGPGVGCPRPMHPFVAATTRPTPTIARARRPAFSKQRTEPVRPARVVPAAVAAFRPAADARDRAVKQAAVVL
jgi:hypothetical protein